MLMEQKWWVEEINNTFQEYQSNTFNIFSFLEILTKFEV